MSSQGILKIMDNILNEWPQYLLLLFPVCNQPHLRKIGSHFTRGLSTGFYAAEILDSQRSTCTRRVSPPFIQLRFLPQINSVLDLLCNLILES